MADKAPVAQLTVRLIFFCAASMAVPAFKFAISESLIGSSVMFGGSIKKLQVGLVDFGTFTTAKEAVEVVEGWSRSATEDILGIKKSKIHRNKTLVETWKKEFSNEELELILE